MGSVLVLEVESIEIQNQLRQFQYECRCYLDPGDRALSNRSMLG
jgi:hypothetical protein